MDVTRILSELRAERAQLEEAVLSLERLARGRGKRRGHPPAWLSNEDESDDPPAWTPTKPSGGGDGAPPAAGAALALPLFWVQEQDPEL